MGDRSAFSQRFSLTDSELERFDIYHALLLKWQRTINLIGPSTTGVIWRRHFWDSAQLTGHASSAGQWLDLGSGAGFPGVICGLIIDRAGGFIHLVESDQRKAAFLREVSRETGLRGEIHNCRIESLAHIPGVDVVTARALASVSALTIYAQEYLLNGAKGLFLKGQDVARELTEAARDSRFSYQTKPSETDAKGCVVIAERASSFLSDR